MIIAVVRWTQDSLHHEQAYGPWTAHPDGSHLGEISRFLRSWTEARPDAHLSSTSLYVVDPPADLHGTETAA